MACIVGQKEEHNTFFQQYQSPEAFKHSTQAPLVSLKCAIAKQKQTKIMFHLLWDDTNTCIMNALTDGLSEHCSEVSTDWY